MPINEIVFAVACFVFGVFTITGAMNPSRDFDTFWIKVIYIVLTIAAWSFGVWIITS